MKGCSAFHLACNGSDGAFRRADLMCLLIDRNADLESRNDVGLTPWLIAAGCVAVDTAMALSQAGGDIFAKTPKGINAADRCARSSSVTCTGIGVAVARLRAKRLRAKGCVGGTNTGGRSLGRSGSVDAGGSRRRRMPGGGPESRAFLAPAAC